MRSATIVALFFAASIALAIAYPARDYYYDDDDEYPQGKALIGRPISLASAPFYYQARTLELDQLDQRGRKYQIVKKKKKGRPQPGSDEDDSQDDEGSDESSEEEDEEEDDENNEENNEEEQLDTPPWEELFPEEDKNTGTFDSPGEGGGGGGYGGGPGGPGGSLSDLPTGGPAPQPQSGGGGFLSSLFGGGSSGGGSSYGGGNSGSSEGPQSDLGGGGGPPQYRQGPPPPGPPPYQAVRARTSIPSVEEPRSGGAVLYDGYRYIPVKPVHVRVPKRQAKKIKTNSKVTPEKEQARSLVPAPAATPKAPRQQKKLSTSSTNKKPQYVLVPVQRDNREIRFSRDQHGLKMESGSVFAPSEIWRWEGPGGRPLRRRENRPSGLYYAPRPHRGSASTIRFAEENDY